MQKLDANQDERARDERMRTDNYVFIFSKKPFARWNNLPQTLREQSRKVAQLFPPPPRRFLSNLRPTCLKRRRFDIEKLDVGLLRTDSHDDRRRCGDDLGLIFEDQSGLPLVLVVQHVHVVIIYVGLDDANSLRVVVISPMIIVLLDRDAG